MSNFQAYFYLSDDIYFSPKYDSPVEQNNDILHYFLHNAQKNGISIGYKQMRTRLVGRNDEYIPAIDWMEQPNTDDNFSFKVIYNNPASSKENSLTLDKRMREILIKIRNIISELFEEIKDTFVSPLGIEPSDGIEDIFKCVKNRMSHEKEAIPKDVSFTGPATDYIFSFNHENDLEDFYKDFLEQILIIQLKGSL